MGAQPLPSVASPTWFQHHFPPSHPLSGFHSNPSGQPGFAAAAALIRIKAVGDGGGLGPGRWRTLEITPVTLSFLKDRGPPFSFIPAFISCLCFWCLMPAQPGSIWDGVSLVFWGTWRCEKKRRVSVRSACSGRGGVFSEGHRRQTVLRVMQVFLVRACVTGG